MSRQAYPAEAAAPGTPKFRRVNRVLPGDRTPCPQPPAPPPPPQPSKKSELILAAITAASTKLSQKRVHPADDRRHQQQQQQPRGAAEVRVSEEEVLSVLECPVCFEYMEAPIHMCANGHNVCAGCLPRCRGACPSCRGPLSASAAPRNLALERLAASAAGGPCRNAFAGCPERRLKASARAAHEAACPFEPLPCALGCGWRGANTSQQLRAHVMAAHARCATAVPDRDAGGRPLSAVHLALSQAGCFRSADHALFAFEHAFAYVKRFSVERRRLALAVRFFGAAEDARRFRYELCLEKGDGEDFECTTFSRAVHHWSKDLATLIEMRKCIVVDFETLVSFGKGTRTFKIVKIPEKNQVDEDRGIYHTELEMNSKANSPLFEISM